MQKYIKVDEIENKLPFVKLLITKKEVDSKSLEDVIEVCELEDMNYKNVTSNIQIHSDIVNEINENNIGQKIEGDALITNIKEVPLLVFTADCVPIAIIDKNTKSIGAIHAGWRGTYSKISQNTAFKMKELYNSNIEDMICVIGPSIGPCCYEVSKDLVEKFNTILTNKDEKFYIIKEDKYYLDLWKINECILKEIGIKEENIINLQTCTSCNCDEFYSYRKHNKTPKRIGMILQIK